MGRAGGAAHFGGAYEYNTCFDPNHGHPVGVTRDMVQAEHDRAAAILKAGQSHYPGLVLTGEGVAENFIDVFTNKLIHFEIWPGYVPLFGAVYHDYHTGYGRTVRLEPPKPGDPLPAMQIGWQLVVGNQIGRLWTSSMQPKYLADEAVARHLDYVKRACAVRERWSDFLALGEMRRPPYLLSEVPTLTTEQGRKTSLPGILASTWASPDGRLMTIVTNITDQPLEARLGIASDTVTGESATLHGDESATLPLVHDDGLAVATLTIEPLGIHVIEWHPKR